MAQVQQQAMELPFRTEDGGAVIDAKELERRVVDAEQEMGRRVDKYAR